MALRLGVLTLAMTALTAAACGAADDGRAGGAASSPTMTRASTSSTAVPESGDAATNAPETAAPTQPDQELDESVESLVGFTSPTGAISCMLDSGYVRCDVQENTWDLPPRPADCEFDYGQGLSMTAGESPEVVCAGDTTAGAGAPLPYGESVTAGPIRCDSARDGVTCRDTASGHGFRVAREGYETF